MSWLWRFYLFLSNVIWSENKTVVSGYFSSWMKGKRPACGLQQAINWSSIFCCVHWSIWFYLNSLNLSNTLVAACRKEQGQDWVWTIILNCLVWNKASCVGLLWRWGWKYQLFTTVPYLKHLGWLAIRYSVEGNRTLWFLKTFFKLALKF